ncbi:aminodeoxychorismate lyase [Thermaerobacillus caldiproteolyticus]|uniref:4-amino-4-deoxychorismate lyase n=1 Tax=Thermaerobacillus caldiproteolyticus TaxID=247480 RepID=A0A7W0C156_9BACL|nr:aminodeoxychorismate lyase [Anoxybacillus caldiproteolyticus]MBA2876729.1 4-amino-4-deoxychorismate lyase [Anoxybacillus caldiproteolyticus]
MYLYVNGDIVHKDEASISPFDHGFMYGLGVFETFRTYDGHPFLLDDHLARLHDSLWEMNIALTLHRNEVTQIIYQLLEANQLKNAYVRLNVSAGVGDIGLQTGEYNQPTVIVYMKPLMLSSSIEKVCRILKTRRNSPEGKERLKSHHYLNNVLGKWEIGNDPKLEGIFLNEKGFIAEGIVSNIFWVKNRTVYTPAVGTGILNGVTRQFVIAMLTALQIDCQEGFYSLDELKEADEVFVTNSIQEIVPVGQVDDCFYLGASGPLTKLLKKHYERFTSFLWTRHELTERIDMK